MPTCGIKLCYYLCSPNSRRADRKGENWEAKGAERSITLIENTSIKRSLNRCKLIADLAGFLLDTGKIRTESGSVVKRPIQRQIELRILI
jgi:hypothetical protein